MNRFDEAVVALRDSKVSADGTMNVAVEHVRVVLERVNELMQERHDDRLKIQELEDAQNGV